MCSSDLDKNVMQFKKSEYISRSCRELADNSVEILRLMRETLDAGGTSTDLCLIEGGRPTVTNGGSVGPFPVRLPMIDIKTIGTGGGSVLMTALHDSLPLGKVYVLLVAADNDRAIVRAVGQKAVELARTLNATHMTAPGERAVGDYNIVPYQSTHNTGGTMMGTTPEEAAAALAEAGADVIGANCGQGIAGFVAICRRMLGCTSSSTNPSCIAFLARTFLPVRIISSAACSPTVRGSRWVPPAPGIKPSCTSGNASTVLATGVESVTSQPRGARSSQTSSNFRNPGMDLAAIVRTGPAATRLQRTLCGPRSRARYRLTDSRVALATPIQSYTGHAMVASNVRPTMLPPFGIAGTHAIASDLSENADTCTAVATDSQGVLRKFPPRASCGANAIEWSTPSMVGMCCVTLEARASR